MKVLVVDDNAVNRKYLRALLAQEGHTVIESEDGLAALRALEHERIDAVISDILMPRMDGYRLCYEIRKNPKLSSIPFLAYSGTYTSPADEKVALDFGADRFLIKPAIPEVIIKALHEAAATSGGHTKQPRAPDELSAMKEYSEALIRKLEETNAELSQANEALNERVVLAEFTTEVSNALTRMGTLREILQSCAQAMVRHLDAAFARIWTVNATTNMLELQASAGMYTHIDGGHARVPVGQFKIGLIASERKPHLTNSVIGDPRVHDQDWARREGMVAFAGYPLLVENRLVGVMAMFARKTLSENALGAMESVSKTIASGIELKQTEDELRQSEERFRELAENINEIFFIAGPGGQPIYYVSPAHENITGQKCETLYQKPSSWLDTIHPDDRARVEQTARSNEGGEQEYRVLRPEGELRWIRARTVPVRGGSGEVLRIVGIAEDITARKLGEEYQKARQREIQALYDLSLKTLNSLDLQQVLGDFLDKAMAVGAYDIGAIRLFDRNSDSLKIAATKGYADQRNIENPAIEIAHPSVGVNLSKAISTGETVIAENLSTSPGWGSFKREGMQSALMIPIDTDEKILGVIQLASRKQRIIEPAEKSLLEALATHAALAIQKAELYDQTRRQAAALAERERVQRILKELSQDITRLGTDMLLEKLTGTIREVFEVDVADVRILAGERWSNIIVSSQHLTQRLPEGRFHGGATEWVIKNRKPIAIYDYQERKDFTPGRVATMFGTRGFLAAPLLSKSGEVLGVIRAFSKKPRNFSARNIDLFEQMANGAAIAIENSRLYADLQASNKVKSEFLSVMSHELRTPLNVIMGYANLVKDVYSRDSTERYYEAAQKIDTQAKTLLDMINSIMEVTQIESGSVSVRKWQVSISGIFQELQATYDSAPRRDLTLVWQAPDNLPLVVTDYEMLHRILKQLIGNAIKFTERGTVTISARLVENNPSNAGRDQSDSEAPGLSAQRYIEFAVADTGIGIAQGQLPVIFDLFKQTDSSSTRPYEGIGLGLYIAKKLSDLIGAKVEVKSEPGKGSTFTVQISCAG